METTIEVEGSTKISRLSKESLKLVRQLARQDEVEDKAALVEKIKSDKSDKEAPTFFSEKAELIKSFEGLTTREEFMRAIISKYEEEKEINMLKNELYGIMVLMLNLEHVSSVVGGDSKGSDDLLLLPPATGQNEFLAAASYYKPQCFLRGTEKQVDNFVKRNILKDEKSHTRFLLQTFYIVWAHMKQKEKELKEKELKAGGIKHSVPDPITPQEKEGKGEKEKEKEGKGGKEKGKEGKGGKTVDSLDAGKLSKALDEVKVVREAMDEEMRVMASSREKKTAVSLKEDDHKGKSKEMMIKGEIKGRVKK